MATKVCNTCKTEKDLDSFYNKKKGIQGKTARCKDCIKERNKQHYIKKRGVVRKPNIYDNGKLYVHSIKHGTKVVLYDLEDEELLKQYTWSLAGTKKDGTCYVSAGILHPDGGYKKDGRPRTTKISMHRLLMNPAKGMEVDHIDHNKINNQKSNLRVCTRAENGRNLRPIKGKSSKYKGVSYCKGTAKHKVWQAAIRCSGKPRRLGLYATEEEAALVYDNAAREYHGEFAYLNFPNGPSEKIMRIIKEGQDSVPEPISKYIGVTLQNGTWRVSINSRLHGNWSRAASCEEEAAWLRDQKVIELGINTSLNFPEGLPSEIAEIIEKAEKKEHYEITTSANERFIYRPTAGSLAKSPNQKPFYVMMQYNGKQKRIGSYNTFEEAQAARDKALLERSEGVGNVKKSFKAALSKRKNW